MWYDKHPEEEEDNFDTCIEAGVLGLFIGSNIRFYPFAYPNEQYIRYPRTVFLIKPFYNKFEATKKLFYLKSNELF